MTRTLDDYHAELEAIMTAGDVLLATRDAANTNVVKQRIGEAMMVLASYQIFVHREVFAAIPADAAPGLAARITELKVECIALTEDLRFNVRDFLASDAPIEDWPRLALRVAWFNRRVREHLHRVHQALHHQGSDREFAEARAARTARVGVSSAA